jgi:uncharacterized protein
MRFEWDPPKAQANLRKRRVAFEDATTIFGDRSILTVHDKAHSANEDRWVSIGLASASGLLVVVHTWPGTDEDGDEVIRLISAPRANRQEQAVYEK